MSVYLGDFATSATVHFLWGTNGANGASIARGTDGTVQVYKNNGTTQSTSGVTDTENFDGLTGVHSCTIDLSADGTFYSSGANFTVVVSGAVIDTQTVNGVLAHFSIENRCALRPTTAGRTLDVSSGGEAGVDWANVGSPTTTVTLSGTTVKTATDVETDTQDIQSRLPAALVGGRMDANAGAISGDATAADNAEAFFDGTGYAGTGNTIPTVTSVTNGVTVTTVNDKTGYRLSATGVDDVWDEAASGHTTSGTFGQALNIIRAGTAQAGAAGTITLDASASATDDFYNNQIVFLTGGTGALQARVISDYVGSTKVASVNTNWPTNPSSDSVFVILPFGLSPASAGLTAADVWSHGTRELTSGANLGTVAANVTQISGDSAAADNAESFFDGTGYAGTNNVIPTVTTLTNAPSDSAGVTTLLSRIPSGLFSGITSMAQWLGLIAGKQSGNATARTEIRATGAGSGTFDETTDSQEALRDNMGTAQTGDAFARLGAPAGASVSADVAAVKSDSAAIKTKTDQLTFTSSNKVDATIQAAGDFAQGAADKVWSTTTRTLSDGAGVKKNTAFNNFMFLMVDDTDGKTPETGLTITAQRSLDGAAFSNCANSASEVASGWYKINLAASDLNGDIVVLRFTASGARTREVVIATEP